MNPGSSGRPASAPAADAGSRGDKAILRRAAELGIGLAFVAGFVDTVGFIALFGLFTAHVTGNFVLIGSVLAHASGGGILLKLLVFPSFIVAVAATRLIVVWLQERDRPAQSTLLVLQALLLAAFLLLGWAASPVQSADQPLAMTAGVVGAAAMGVQNAGARLVLSNLAPTTVMTGNVTQLVIDAVDLARGTGDAAIRERSRKFIAPIVAFALGAIGGAFGFVYAGFAALLLPIVVLCALGGIVAADDADRASGSASSATRS